MTTKNISLNQPLVPISSEEAINTLIDMEYKKYLRTEYWGLVRRVMHEIIGYKCEVCGTDKYIAIHHFNYDNLGKETVNDLACLCEQCHIGIHNSESAILIDPIRNREEFEKIIKTANEIKKVFSNKLFLKVLPLTQLPAWEIRQLQFLFECSADEARRMFDEELKLKLVVKSYGVCADERFEFYSLDRFIWHIIRLDFPVLE